MLITDLRSDTVTKPTPEMRRFMAEAEVGDDVFSEDPTVMMLESESAALLGKEAALYCPTGCMTNQLAIATHTQPGDEVIVEAESHVFNYETTAASYLSRVQLNTITARDKGLLSVDEVAVAIRDSAYYMPRTRMLVIENTINRGGGRVYRLDSLKELTALTSSRGIVNHLDGARLWNACAASGVTPSEYAQHFDTISICFSKGLGAPVGSCLVGTKATIESARRFRKIWGGGMRQVGIIAAGALYALRNNQERIAEDNYKAKRFAEILFATNSTLQVDLEIVTHMDVSLEDCEKAAYITAEHFSYHAT
jgi:threonine aldolase